MVGLFVPRGKTRHGVPQLDSLTRSYVLFIGALAELINVVTMANETNRLAFAYRLNADQMYEKLYQKENAKKLAEM